MRQFAEALTHATAANFGIPTSTETAFIDVLRGLNYRVPEGIVYLSHDVRRLGNQGTHSPADEHRDALTADWMTAPVEVEPGILVETNLAAEGCTSGARRLMEYAGLDVNLAWYTQRG